MNLAVIWTGINLCQFGIYISALDFISELLALEPLNSRFGPCPVDIFTLKLNPSNLLILEGRSGGAMVLGKLPVSGRPTIWITVGQGPTAPAVGAGGGCLDILIYPFCPLSPSLLETARYRLKYCLKGPLNPKQPTNQSC